MRSSTSIEEIEIFYLLKEATQKKVELPKNKYELSNHLGNVLVTTSDLRKGADNNVDGIADYYNAIVTTANDYFAFGSLMGGRQYNSTGYAYSFNTQLKSDEISGNGNHTTALFWEYDTRLGRRWNVDPIVKYWESPYACISDNPIALNDILGNTSNDPNKYTIEKGDTYDGIAKKSNGAYTVDDLKKWNPNVDPLKLQIGSEINIADPEKIKAREQFESDEGMVDPINHDLDFCMREAKTTGGKAQSTCASGFIITSLLHYGNVEFTGDILEKIKNDPDFITSYNLFVSDAKKYFNNSNNPSYYQEMKPIEFGSKLEVKNPLFWVLAQTNVKFWAEKTKNDGMRVDIRIADRLDLGPNANYGRTRFYRYTTLLGGIIYHGLLGGNRGMITRAQWSVNVK